jgi:DNA helicase-2/ATP-dependent DNA helicase PcrA
VGVDGDTCTVIDYKTGNPGKKEHLLPPNDKNPLGGDYWRQMVFYKLLLENNPDKRYQVKLGAFDYIEPDRKTGKPHDLVYVPVFESDETTVRQQLKDAYGRIMNHDFDTGCGKKDCSWCQFARQYRIIRQPEESFVEIDDV